MFTTTKDTPMSYTQLSLTEHFRLYQYHTNDKLTMDEIAIQMKREGIHSNRGGILGRIGIEHRPAIADLKTEIGHWESDTVIGANHTGIIVTHVDKASKFLLAGLAHNKSVQQINQITIGLFEQLGETLAKR
jgi:IS30 family transposase